MMDGGALEVGFLRACVADPRLDLRAGVRGAAGRRFVVTTVGTRLLPDLAVFGDTPTVE
jgi:hypothetical protein